MLLIIEILLTISAWRRGYKAWALLPMGLSFFIGVMIGLNDPEAAASGDLLDYIWIDILAVVVLGIMIAAAGKTEEDEEQQLEATGKEEKSLSHRELAHTHSEAGLN